MSAPVRPHQSATPDVPFKGLWPFLAIAFGLVYALLALLLLWGEELEAVLGPLRASHPFFILAVWSPAIAAWSVILATTGPRGFAGYLGRLAVWRCGWAWAAFILVAIPAIYYLAAWIKGDPFRLWPFDSMAGALSAIGLMLILGPMEEFGWRDLMQPLLQRRMTPFAAALVVGLVWGAWHLPPFFLSGTPQSNWDFLPFLAGAVAVSVIITPLFNTLRGGILLPMVFHFQLNNPIFPDGQPVDMGLFVLAAAAVTWVNRATMFDRTAGATRVTGLS